MSKIIVVENDSQWFAQFTKILKLVGEQRNVVRVELNELFSNYTNGASFDEVDYCFIDLELGPAINPEINDMYGLDRVLPHVRTNAPWIPCACISRFITGNPDIIDRLSVSDFDGIFPKRVISEGQHTHPSFNGARWERILEDLSIKRNSSLAGVSVTRLRAILNDSNAIHLQLSDSVKDNETLKNAEQFKKAISLCGIIGSVLSVDEIVSGFSGINVLKVSAYGDDSKGQIKSTWLIKFGVPIRKIAEEAAAHMLMLQRGLHRSLMIPLLVPNVIVWNGIGYIVYAFEEDAISALNCAIQFSATSLTVHIEMISDSLYSRKKPLPVSVTTVLKKWANIDISELPYLNNADFNRNYEVTCALVHGDLHLRNILIKSNVAVLIDFARSDLAPISIDAAKLLIDLFAFAIPDKINCDIFDFDKLCNNSDCGQIANSFRKHLVNKDDLKLASITLRAFATKYLTYPDVPEIAKQKFREFLS